MPFSMTDDDARNLVRRANELGNLRAACREVGLSDARAYHRAYGWLRLWMARNGYELRANRRYVKARQR